MKDGENIRLFHMGCGESLGVSRLTSDRWSRSWLFSAIKKGKEESETALDREDKEDGGGNS